MTIAIGILARDGFVIAADSEISTSGQGVDFSATQNKVFPFSDSGDGVMIITGAGPAHHLEALAFKLGEIFKDHPKDSLTELEVPLQNFIIAFYADHLLPFMPHSTESVSLIIAARRYKKLKRWEVSLNSLKDWKALHTATGAGEMPAKSMMDKLIRGCDLESAKIMAAFIVWTMKQRIVGCGHGTSVAALKGNEKQLSTFTPLQISKLEQIFADYAYCEGSILSHIFGSTSASATQSHVHDFI